MNKVVFRESGKKHVIVDIVYYCTYVILGFTLLNFADMGLRNPINHAPCMFFTLAFFSIVAYFINRRKGNYEFLFQGFINVVVATFILVYTAYPDSGFILADAVLLFSIANVLNKGYSCKVLIDNRDINFFPKISTTILLLFLGVFVVASLYDKIDVGVLILGYYFIIFGLLSLLEPLDSIVLGNAGLKRRVRYMLAYDKLEETKEEKIDEVKEVEEEKPVKVKKTTTRVTSSKKPVNKVKAEGNIKKTTTVRKTPSKKTSNKKTVKK